MRRNFQGYTNDTAQALLGLGATSISRTPSGFVQNIAETGAWARTVQEGLLPIAKGHTLCGDDALRAYVIEKLMCDAAVDTAAAGRLFGYAEDWCSDALPDLREMADDGLLVLDGGTVRMTEQGRIFVRVAAAAFDRYRQQAPARHSIAV